MKQILLLTAALFMFSCSDDSNNSTIDSLPSLAGQWKTIEAKNTTGTYSFHDCTEESDGLFLDYTITSEASFNSHPRCNGEDLTFDENGSFTYVDGVLTLDSSPNYVDKYSVIFIDSNKIKIDLLWNSITGESNDEYYLILERQNTQLP